MISPSPFPFPFPPFFPGKACHEPQKPNCFLLAHKGRLLLVRIMEAVITDAQRLPYICFRGPPPAMAAASQMDYRNYPTQTRSLRDSLVAQSRAVVSGLQDRLGGGRAP